jgi:hypothetical protein
MKICEIIKCLPEPIAYTDHYVYMPYLQINNSIFEINDK